jgi:hypothetical protein
MSSGSSFLHYVLEREIRPPTPRSEATVCAVTTGDIAELAATTVVALCPCFAVVSHARLDTVEKQCGGESVSQSLLKSKAFSTFSRQNPPIELLSKAGVRLQSFMESIVAYDERRLSHIRHQRSEDKYEHFPQQVLGGVICRKQRIAPYAEFQGRRRAGPLGRLVRTRQANDLVAPR